MGVSRNELKHIHKDMSRELIRDIVNNTELMNDIAKQVADMANEKIDKSIERINLAVQSMKDEISIIEAENKQFKQKVDELQNRQLTFLWGSRGCRRGFEEGYG